MAKEMQRTAAETRSVSEAAAARIQQSRRIQQRLGASITVGPPLSQSMSSANINGRVSKTISLVMPVFTAAGVPAAQAQVTQVESGGRVDSCRIAVSCLEREASQQTAAVADAAAAGAAAGAARHVCLYTPACPFAQQWWARDCEAMLTAQCSTHTDSSHEAVVC